MNKENWFIEFFKDLKDMSFNEIIASLLIIFSVMASIFIFSIFGWLISY